MAPAWIGWKGSKEGSAGMTGADAAAAGGGSDASGGGEHAPAPLHQQHLDGGASSSSVGSDPATLPSDGATDAEEAGRASSPRPEEDEERVGGRRQGLTVSISGLSLSSAGGEQEGQQEGPSPLISPRSTYRRCMAVGWIDG